MRASLTEKSQSNKCRMLQFNDLRTDQRKKPYIWVNTRELNGVLSTAYLPIYTN